MDALETRIEGDGLLKLINGFRQETCLAVRAADEYTKLWAITKLNNHAVVKLLGRGELPPLQQGQTQRIDYFVIFRGQPERGLKLLLCLLKLTDQEVGL